MLGDSPRLYGFSKDYIGRWENMLQKGENMLSYLTEQINPKIYKLYNVKKAVVLLMASGGDR